MLFAADEFRRIVSAEQAHVTLLQNHQSTPTVVFRQSLAFYDRLPPTSPFLVGCVCAALSRCASIAAAVNIYDRLWRALMQETRQPTRPRPYVPLTDPHSTGANAANATATSVEARPSSSSSSMRGTATRQQQQQQQQRRQPQPHHNPTTTQHRVSTPNQATKSSNASSSLSPASRLRHHHRSAKGLGLGPSGTGDEEEDLDLRVDIADDDGESGDEEGNHYIDHLLQLPDFQRPLQGSVKTGIIVIHWHSL